MTPTHAKAVRIGSRAEENARADDGSLFTYPGAVRRAVAAISPPAAAASRAWMRTHSSRLLLAGIVCLAAWAFASGCRKSAKDSTQQEPQKFTREEANQEFQKQLKVAGMQQTLDAGQFLARLLESHRLPGAENAEAGAMLSPASVYTSQSTNYPMSREFVGQRKLGGPWENHYVVMKKSADDPWQLQRAWRADVQGNTVDEYPVKR